MNAPLWMRYALLLLLTTALLAACGEGDEEPEAGEIGEAGDISLNLNASVIGADGGAITVLLPDDWVVDQGEAGISLYFAETADTLTQVRTLSFSNFDTSNLGGQGGNIAFLTRQVLDGLADAGIPITAASLYNEVTSQLANQGGTTGGDISGEMAGDQPDDEGIVNATTMAPAVGALDGTSDVDATITAGATLTTGGTLDPTAELSSEATLAAQVGTQTNGQNDGTAPGTPAAGSSDDPAITDPDDDVDYNPDETGADPDEDVDVAAVGGSIAGTQGDTAADGDGATGTGNTTTGQNLTFGEPEPFATPRFEAVRGTMMVNNITHGVVYVLYANQTAVVFTFLTNEGLALGDNIAQSIAFADADNPPLDANAPSDDISPVDDTPPADMTDD